MKDNLPCKKNELVWIRWIDASGESCRVHVDDLANLHSEINTNLGWVVAENDQVLRLAHGISTTGEVDCFKVPVANIVERIPVVPPRKRPVKKEPTEE